MAKRAKKKPVKRANAAKSGASLRIDAVVERGHTGARYEGEVGRRWGRWFMCVDDESLRALGLAEGDTARITLKRRPANELDPQELPRLPGVRLAAARNS
jgi:hypothetical protein